MSSGVKSLAELTEKLEYEELKEENERLTAENKQLIADYAWSMGETRRGITEYKELLEWSNSLITELFVCIVHYVKREHWPRVVVELCGVAIVEAMNGSDKEV